MQFAKYEEGGRFKNIAIEQEQCPPGHIRVVVQVHACNIGRGIMCAVSAVEVVEDRVVRMNNHEPGNGSAIEMVCRCVRNACVHVK